MNAPPPDAASADERVPEVEAAVDEDALPDLAALVEALSDVAEAQGSPEEGMILSVESLLVELPVELRLLFQPGGRIGLQAAPPLQRIETTIMPVFHSLRLRVEPSDAE